jgi:DNA-binding transcriptional ArsR family regulator
MDAETVFSKTAKGDTEVNQKPHSLPRQLTKVLKAVDGHSMISALADKVGLAIPALEKDLMQLERDGYITIRQVNVEEEKFAEEESRRAQVARLKELAEQAAHRASRPVETAARKQKRIKPKREVPVGLIVTFGTVVLVVLAIALIQVVPLGSMNAKVEKALAAWSHDDVSSSNLRVSLFPKPYLKLDQVALGKALDAKATSGKLYIDVLSMFGDKFVVNSMELNDVTISAEALPRALKWAGGEGRGSQIQIDRIVLNNVKLAVKGVALDPFDAQLQFDRNGRIVRGAAKTRDSKFSIEAYAGTTNPPSEGAIAPWVVDVAARNWTPPIGAGISFSMLSGKGIWADNQIVFPDLEAKLFEGSGKGNLTITLPGSSLANGQIMAQSEFTIERAKVDQLVSTFTRDIALSGRMEMTFAASVVSATFANLLDTPNIVGSFQVREGAMSNVDLVQAMRNPGSVGGQTKYTELGGKFSVSDSTLQLHSLKLHGGVLFAGGSVGVALGTGTLSGTVTSEIRSNITQDRAVFGLSGTVARPALKRGG